MNIQITGRPIIHYGPRKAHICINGKSFALVYTPRYLNEYMMLDDARILPLDAIDENVHVAISTVNRGYHEALVVRLHFSRTFVLRYDRFNFPFERTTTFAVRSSRNSTVRRILADNSRRLLLAESRMIQLASEGEDSCFVCTENMPNARFTPCSHSGLCCACAYKIFQLTKTCPLCRGKVTSFQRVL